MFANSALNDINSTVTEVSSIIICYRNYKPIGLIEHKMQSKLGRFLETFFILVVVLDVFMDEILKLVKIFFSLIYIKDNYSIKWPLYIY